MISNLEYSLETVIAKSTKTITWSDDEQDINKIYKVEFFNGLNWELVYSGQNFNFRHTVPKSNINNAKYRVRSLLNGEYSDYITGESFVVFINNPPTLDYVDDLGIVTKDITYTLKISTDLGKSLEVYVYIEEDSDIFHAVNYTANSITIAYNDLKRYVELWKDSILKIKVNDGFETFIYEVKFTLGDNLIEVITKPYNTTVIASKFIVGCIYNKDVNDVIRCYVCNNGFDTNPTWEDCTDCLISGNVYEFTNKTYSSTNPGISIRMIINKG